MFFGERFGVISPRASYMRSVCGCISASSAATEIMNTPRSPVEPPRRRRPRLDARLRAGRLRSRSSAHQPSRDDADASRSSALARVVVVDRLGELVERLALLGG